MPDQITQLAVITIAATPIAIEATANLPLPAQKASDFEMIGAGEHLSASIGDLNVLIKGTATALVESIKSLEQNVRPKKIEAEFSIGFSAEAGFWYVAKGSATGAIKITLEWQT